MKTKVPKDYFVKYFIITICILITGGMIYLSNSIMLHILAFLFLTMCAVLIVRFDFYHPYVWYTPLFCIYSISHPVLYILDYSIVNAYTKSLMLYQWVALSVFLLIVTPKRVNIVKTRPIINKRFEFHYVNKYVLIGLSLVLLVTILYISQLGHQNKRELFDMNSLIVFIGFRAVHIFLLVYTLELIKGYLMFNKLNIKLILYSFTIIFFLFLFSGERDLILRHILLTFFIHYIFNENSFKNRKKYIYLAIIAMIFMPILNSIKYIGVGMGLNKNIYNNLFVSFFTSDFSSASTNLQLLLLNSEYKSIFNGYSIFIDILRSLDVFNIYQGEYFSSAKWFNNIVFRDRTSGMGFTLVGEGYLNYGILGVVLIYSFISILIKKLYFKSFKNTLIFILYIFSIPIYIYSIRGDLVSIFSPLIGQILLSVVILKSINSIVKGIKYKSIRCSK